MKLITRVPRLSNYGVFHNFIWPPDLVEFGRYNLIYGWNGTGKTTLSRLFRNLELRQSPAIGEATLRVGDRDIQGREFPQSNLQVRVFNRDFIQENVFPVEAGDIPSILILGATNVEKQKKVEDLKRQLVAARANCASKNSNRDDTCKNFEDFCKRSAKVIKDTLRSSGQHAYNNYNKASFRNTAEEMLKAGEVGTYRLSDVEQDELLSQLRATAKPKVPELTYALRDFKSITDRLSELLSISVVSAAIDSLKGDPKLADWTWQGLALHRDRNAERCHFCEQPMPMERLNALEGHFNDNYERFIQRIDSEISQLRTESRVSTELKLPTEAEFYGDLKSAFESAMAELTGALESAKGFFDVAVQTLEGKKHRPFEHVELKLEVPAIKEGAVERLNGIIRSHNRVCDDFDSRVTDARDRLAANMIAADVEEFARRRETAEQAKLAAEAEEQNVQRLGCEISRLEREIVEHRRPAEELNEDLYKYLGHGDLRLEIKETGYALTRRGEVAHFLSEGESTAIALLYFLKSLEDRRFALSEGVVVLDDPVSSLDANALFLAFGFIQKRTTCSGQLFILTHNFSFFKEVRNWFRSLKGQKRNDIRQRPARFFMLGSVTEYNTRNNVIRRLDRLLEEYGSEYHYLFARVYRASTDLASQNIEQNYVLPNMARRMLETFLAFRLPQYSGTENLWKKVHEVRFEDEKKLRVLRYLNTYSHSPAMGESEHDPTALAEGPAVLKDLLEMIQSMDREHYSAMVRLVSSLENSEETED